MQDNKSINICPSKSDGERALICSYLAEIQDINNKAQALIDKNEFRLKNKSGLKNEFKINNESELKNEFRQIYEAGVKKAEERILNLGSSEDVLALRECLRECLKKCSSESLGLCLDNDIKDSNFRETPIILNCKKSGANLRFLIPIVSALGLDAVIRYEGRKRPIKPLIETLEEKGIRFAIREGEVKTQGRLKGGNFEIDGNISSQFISGLLFALPLTENGGNIIIKGHLESSGYVEMTISALEKSGIYVKKNKSGYEVRGGERYAFPNQYAVEGDWSNGSIWIAINLLRSIGRGAGRDFSIYDLLKFPIKINGLDFKSNQPDKKIMNLLEKFVKIGEDGKIYLGGDSVIDARDNPDIIPILSGIASLNDGTTLITNASRLRLKESDRIETICDILFKLGIDIEETSDGLIIYGAKRLRGASVKSYDDHRIVMLAALMSLACKDKVTIENSEAINKSYPEFKSELKRLSLDTNIEWR